MVQTFLQARTASGSVIKAIECPCGMLWTCDVSRRAAETWDAACWRQLLAFGDCLNASVCVVGPISQRSQFDDDCRVVQTRLFRTYCVCVSKVLGENS